MRISFYSLLLTLLLTLSSGNVWSHNENYKYAEAKNIFSNASQSSIYFKHSYGYALFPAIGKGGIGIGGGYGKGRVYKNGNYVGNTSVKQLTIGFQLGGQAYRQIIFFKDKRSFDEFSSGNFEFGAQASAVAITAGASAAVSTVGGTSTGASTGKNDVSLHGAYHKGTAVFTIAKGGLMYEASLGGQKFNYKSRHP